MSSVTAAPWHAAYPAPKSIVDTLSRGDLLQMFADGKKPGRDILLIDLRRTDHEVCLHFSLPATLHLQDN